MSISRSTYTREFKLEALRLWQTRGKSAAEIERELGTGAGNLSRWKAKLRADGEHAFPAEYTEGTWYSAAFRALQVPLGEGGGHGRLKPRQETIRQLKREKAIVLQEIAIIRKGYHLRDEKKAVRFQFIDDHRDEFAVNTMCELLEVSPSGYYAWRSRRRQRP